MTDCSSSGTASEHRGALEINCCSSMGSCSNEQHVQGEQRTSGDLATANPWLANGSIEPTGNSIIITENAQTWQPRAAVCVSQESNKNNEDAEQQ